MIRVTDDGAGPSPDIVDLMFDAFVSGHVPDGMPGSFGLGLSISRSLARHGRGRALRPGRGNTRFSLYLPSPTDHGPPRVDNLSAQMRHCYVLRVFTRGIRAATILGW